MAVVASSENNVNHERSGIQSAEVAADILKALVQLDRRAPLREVAQCVGLHPAKVHRYLVSLVRTDLAIQDPSTGFYGLGPFALRLGVAALRQNDTVGIASMHLHEARTGSAQSVLLTVWSGSAPMAVRRLEDVSSPVYRNASIGSSLPLFGSASGKAFAAFLPHEVLTPILEEEKKRFADQAAAARLVDSTLNELAEIRARGFAYVRGNYVAGTSSLAAPVFDGEGNMAAAVAVIGRTAEISIEPDGENAIALLKCTQKISETLGFGGRIRTT